MYGVANDAVGNLYVSEMGQTAKFLECGPLSPSCTLFDLTYPQDATGEALLDEHGNFVLSDTTANDIDVYAPGATAPARTIAAGYTPEAIALDKGDKNLYLVDGKFGAVEIYDYKTGALTGSISNGVGSPLGVATYPRQPLGKSF